MIKEIVYEVTKILLVFGAGYFFGWGYTRAKYSVNKKG